MKGAIPKLSILSAESFAEEVKARKLDDARISVSYLVSSESNRTAIKSWYVILTAYDPKAKAVLEYERMIGYDLLVFEDIQKELLEKAKKASEELRKKLADSGVNAKDGRWSA